MKYNRGMRRTISRRPIFWLLIVALLLVVGLGVWHFKHHGVVIPSTQPQSHAANRKVQPGTASKQSPPNNSPGPGTVPPGKANSTGTGSTAPLTAPTGTFISNHHPGQNGTPTTENSTCITTPGATCYIQFTMGTAVHKLNAGTAGGDGTVVWNWNVADAGFSSGNWQITAIASLGGQTKSTTDQLPLEIQ